MCTLSEHVLSGQLNAMLKGCDHEIVRALNTHPKAVLWKLELFFVWLWAFRFIVNAHSTGLLTECFVITILITEALVHH